MGGIPGRTRTCGSAAASRPCSARRRLCPRLTLKGLVAHRFGKTGVESAAEPSFLDFETILESAGSVRVPSRPSRVRVPRPVASRGISLEF